MITLQARLFGMSKGGREVSLELPNTTPVVAINTTYDEPTGNRSHSFRGLLKEVDGKWLIMSRDVLLDDVHIVAEGSLPLGPYWKVHSIKQCKKFSQRVAHAFPRLCIRKATCCKCGKEAKLKLHAYVSVRRGTTLRAYNLCVKCLKSGALIKTSKAKRCRLCRKRGPNRHILTDQGVKGMHHVHVHGTCAKNYEKFLIPRLDWREFEHNVTLDL